jgi:hypothetical protein
MFLPGRSAGPCTVPSMLFVVMFAVMDATYMLN